MTNCIQTIRFTPRQAGGVIAAQGENNDDTI